MSDPYKTLNVNRDASAADIKKAYRELAKRYHPDTNQGDKDVERKFKEVSQAYSILGDAERRAQFDRGEIDADGRQSAWGSGYRRSYAGTGAGGDHDPFGFAGGGGAEDLFSEMFRGRRKGGFIRRKGADVNYTVPVDFLEAAKGAKKRIKLGDGKTLNVTIPPGTEDRDLLRLKGQGLSGMGGASDGDALVEVHIEPHAFFTRKDDNIHLELPVTLQEALLGATVPAPTIHGQVTMRIPAESNSGTTLRLKEKGIHNKKTGKKGDQYVKLRIVLPDKPDSELNSFVESWGKSNRYDPRRKAGMLDKE